MLFLLLIFPFKVLMIAWVDGSLNSAKAYSKPKKPPAKKMHPRPAERVTVEEEDEEKVKRVMREGYEAGGDSNRGSTPAR